ncbi:hypothetical protein BD289DRAFT_367419 [Coniella lustricola]|uniref:6-methylsalicylate decarboxylase n=1 Tax=Coniella lustricola TaxID=2025994 RepID=A0A2T3A9I8_9PEZI|nr:hypothetical protein BD289DRAFT_367419 [Coniella lustricola]
MRPVVRLLAKRAARIQAGAGRIDTHIHCLPPQYLAELNKIGGNPSGFPTPEWTPESCLASMRGIGTTLGILSVSTPGAAILGDGPEARKLARSFNDYLGHLAVAERYNNQFGFFGVIPSLSDLEGALDELDYLFTQQKLCSGITLFTSYGGKLLGHPDFKPFFAKLQHYKALVFIHPTLLDVEPKFIAETFGGGLPQPILDYPLATTRAAIDLVISGTVHACPAVDFILSHAGGALPFVGTRALGSLMMPGLAARFPVNVLQARSDVGRFYYDIALSSTPAQLNGLLDFVGKGGEERVLFGSDYPYAPQVGIDHIVLEHTRFVQNDVRGPRLSAERMRANAIRLLNKHAFEGRLLEG